MMPRQKCIAKRNSKEFVIDVEKCMKIQKMKGRCFKPKITKTPSEGKFKSNYLNSLQTNPDIKIDSKPKLTSSNLVKNNLTSSKKKLEPNTKKGLMIIHTKMK